MIIKISISGGAIMLTVSGLPQKFHKYYDFRFPRKIIIFTSRRLTIAPINQKHIIIEGHVKSKVMQMINRPRS